jgi:hypothetical protein
MAICCGVNFHARQQTVWYCDTSVGEIQLAELHHIRTGDAGRAGMSLRFL